MRTSLTLTLERRNKSGSPVSLILGGKRTWLPNGNFASCCGLITQRIKSKEASRAGSSRVWIPELGSLKIWADFTWTTGTEPRDSGESRYA
jgi:hypothetical protein